MFRRAQRDASRSATLAGFRRQVVALLSASGVNGRRLDSTQALRLMLKWDRMLRRRFEMGKTAYDVASHIVKYEKQGVVCPCARDADGPCPRCRGKTARDVQIVITDRGSSKKRQRYNPAKDPRKRRSRFKPRRFFKRKPAVITPSPSVSRDFAGELRHLSLQALGRLLTKAYRSGDEEKCHLIEKEIDRRAKGGR